MDYYSKIVQSVYGKQDARVRHKIVLHILLYLFKAENITRINKRIRQILKEENNLRKKVNVVSLRKKFVTSGYVFNLKAFLFAVVAFEGKVSVKDLAEKYQVMEEDVILTKFLRNKRLRSCLEEYAYTYRVMSLGDFRCETEALLEEIDVWTRKFIMRKKKFIMKAFSMDLEDLVNDLLLRGIRGLILQYPCFESHLHMKNLLKKTVHNYGINVIKFFTRTKRNEVNSKVSYDAIVDGLLFPRKNGETKVVSAFNENNDAQPIMGNTESALDLQISVSQLLKRSKTEKRKTMIRLLMGEQDKAFTAWLIKRRICKDNVDNVELQYRCLEKNKLEKYKLLVFKYLGFSEEKGERILQRLGEQLL